MRSKLSALVLVACVSFVCGCGRSEPQFSYREGLSPVMQDYVRTAVDQKFGTPHKIRVWDKLPLQPHAAVATVAEGSKDSALTIQLDAGEHRPLKSGQEVAWVGGTVMPRGSAPAFVKSFDAETNLLELVSAPALSPKVGDKIVIGPGEVLTRGRLLYAEHCQHCHGVAGDGQGPTAPYLNVRPRDYRKGLFKFTSTKVEKKAHRNDLARIVEEGIPGTYMPSFKLLKGDESAAIIEYVLFLAMRGETEFKLNLKVGGDYSKEAMDRRIKEGETESKIVDEFVSRTLAGEFHEMESEDAQQMISQWIEAQSPEAAIVPAEKRYASNAESIQRGRELFLSSNLGCVNCHGESGLGDGIQTYSVNKPNVVPGLFDDWGNKIKPRNLRLGMFRGGRRPIDIYCRIEAGIKGTPMAAFGAKMTEQQKWDLVNFILELPHETRTPGAGVAPHSPAAATDKVAVTTH